MSKPLEEQLAAIPLLHATIPIHPRKKIVHIHFYSESLDFYGVEYAPKAELFFGFVAGPKNDPRYKEASLNNWKGFSIESATQLAYPETLEHDTEWQPTPAEKINKIKSEMHW